MPENKKYKRLVLLVHGYGGSPKMFQDVIEVAQEAYPDETLVNCEQWGHGKFTNNDGAAKISQDILDHISALDQKHEFSEIILAGHSSGAALLRRVFVEATGLAPAMDLPIQNCDEDGTCELTAKFAHRGETNLVASKSAPWSKKVSRLVLISGVGRGWSLDTVSGMERVLWGLGALFGFTRPLNKAPTIFDLRLGAPFIVQTRLRWLHMRHNLDQKLQVFQIVGSIDGVVPPVDHVDQIGDSKVDYTLIQMPKTNHGKSIKLSARLDPDTSIDDLNQRRRIIKESLLGELSNEVRSQNVVARDFVGDDRLDDPDTSVKDVVFVIHGIRDFGFWTSKIASRVKALAEQKYAQTKDKARMVSFTPSYGYFAMLPFVFPWVRRRKVEWLMDQYVEVRAKYPNAHFHYVGHSNGTYLCAEALKRYPMARFENIMFAGSVVRQDYPWGAMFKDGRVGKVLNLIATRDFVVAIFPNAFRWPFWPFRLFDLGGAGHDGFTASENEPMMFQISDPKQRYIEGAHSAAVEEEQWDEIAQFVVNGKEPSNNDNSFRDSQHPAATTLGILAPAVLVTLLGIVSFVGVFVFDPVWAKSDNDERGIGAIRAIGGVVGLTFLLFVTWRFSLALVDHLKTSVPWLIKWIGYAATFIFAAWLVWDVTRGSAFAWQIWSNTSDTVKYIGLGAYLLLLRFVVLRF